MENLSGVIANCIAGDRRSQKAFYDHYSPLVFPICIKYTNTIEDAEDCLQMGFVKVFTRLYQFKFEGSFDGWLKRIFVTTTLTELRKKRNYTYSLDFTDTYSKENTGYDNLLIKDVNKAIENSPRGYRDNLKLHLEGFSCKEIGNILHLQECTSKSQVCRAKKYIKKML